GSVWTQQAKLTGTGATARSAGKLGSSVALSADGNTALVGGPEDGPGAVWVFTRSGSTRTQPGAEVTGTGEVGAHAAFGSSVALSSDGNTGLIGGPGDATVVEREGEVVEKSAIVKGLSTTAGIFAGSSVSGTKIESGTFVANVRGEHEVELSNAVEGTGTATVKEKLTFTSAGVGAAWAFARAGSTWTQQGSKLTGSEGKGFPEFGASLALSANATTALIGGPGDNSEAGAAWVFTRSGSTFTQGAKLMGTEGI